MPKIFFVISENYPKYFWDIFMCMYLLYSVKDYIMRLEEMLIL